MIAGFKIKTIDDVSIKDKRVLVRVDYNVSFTKQHKVADDLRIRQSLPTLRYLLKGNNKIILMAHLGQPKHVDNHYSLEPLVKNIKELLPGVPVSFLDNFDSENGQKYLASQKPGEIILLENLRFHPEEKENNEAFAKKLSHLADIYVNDAFGVSHRKDASIVSIPEFIPSYAGLLLKREVEEIGRLFFHPKKPVVAIIGGAKISTKLHFLHSLIDKIDVLLLGGGLANTFLLARGIHAGRSLVEEHEVGRAKDVIHYAKKRGVKVILPEDAVVVRVEEEQIVEERVCRVEDIKGHESIFDIGPETQAEFGAEIASAHTLLWNGPVGFVENPRFARGTDFLFYAIAQNENAYSLVGGGDTIAAISKKEYIDKITWVSTGGGAMIEFIEKGTLPGLKALTERA